MSNIKKGFSDVDSLLNNLFSYEDSKNEIPLRLLFEQRLKSLDITLSASLEILDIESRTLKGILDGKQKLVDFVSLIKIANFLQIPKEKVVQLYMIELEKNHPIEMSYPPEKIEFIKQNFDLATLKKSGFINSITDYADIEKKITAYFGFKNIFEYRPSKLDVAFSSGLITPKNGLARELWVTSAEHIFKALDNPYPYNRQALIDYFPDIRWYSTNVEIGLLNVIKSLYKMGVTVIYQDSLSSLHLRGATFAVNRKPCIVLTNYRGFYPTLWFALIHELFHVLFDWEDIKNGKYHLSDTEEPQLTVLEKEREADDFAREYLFSREKTSIVKSFIYNHTLVEEYAKNNHVHSSFIYVYYAKDVGEKNRLAWARAYKYNPSIEPTIKHFDNSWKKSKSVLDFVNHLKTFIFNN